MWLRAKACGPLSASSRTHFGFVRGTCGARAAIGSCVSGVSDAVQLVVAHRETVALRIISGLWLFAGQLTHFSPRKPAYSPAAQVSEHLNFAQLKVAFRCDPHCASRSDTRRCRPVSPDAFAMLVPIRLCRTGSCRVFHVAVPNLRLDVGRPEMMPTGSSTVTGQLQRGESLSRLGLFAHVLPPRTVRGLIPSVDKLAAARSSPAVLVAVAIQANELQLDLNRPRR